MKTTQTALILAITFAFSSAASAVVTSDANGTHVTTPGTPAYGLNVDGVVGIGDAELLLATGALITDRHVLTVAHLFDLDEDGQVGPGPFGMDIFFDLPSGRVAVAIQSVVVPPAWPDSYPPDDLAIVTLAEDAPAAAPRYPLYGLADEVGRETVIVGYGAKGHGSTGVDDDLLTQEKRAGRNRYEALIPEVFGPIALPSFLVYDFDSGLPQQNALELLGISSDLGFGDDEVNGGPGDSGGPVFIGGAIAGITQGGFGADIVPLLTSDVTPLSDCSWGEVSLDTRVSYHRDFITTATAGQAVFVPEPSALAALLSLGAISLPVYVLNRRRRANWRHPAVD